MIDNQNITPQRFAIIFSSIMSIILLILCLLLKIEIIDILLLVPIFFIISFTSIFYGLKSFIYRNVRMIYKLIYNTRASKKEEFLYEKITPKKSMAEVSQEVTTWANQKNQEIQLLRNNEAFRKEFLQNLAHEIKTPLFTAQGYIQSLKDGAIDEKEIAMKFLEKAAISIERLTELTNDIDAISKLESGQTILNKEVFIIQHLIKSIFEEFELIRKEKEASFSFKTGSVANIQVFADKSRIRQVLVNLIQNALKYGQNGIEVSIGCYVLDPNTAYLEVSDNGPGIEQQHLPRLFERFYRVDKSRDRKIAGTGLGLAIVKHIIEAHGHTVNVRSSPQIGTTFGFTLSKRKE